MKKGLRWLAVLSVCTLVVTSEGAGLLHAQQTDIMPGSSETKIDETEVTETESTEQPGTEIPEEPGEKPTEKPENKPKPAQQGLEKNSDGTYSYYIDGIKLKNSWKTIKGNKYYFAKNGNAYTGLQKIKNNYFYFSKDGKMQTGWKKIGKRKCYFSPKTGQAYTGKKKIKNGYYYFSKTGEMQTGWKKIGGRKYYFSEKSGKAYTGKKKVKDSYYYFASNGKMETGWKTIEKKQFYFSQKSGKMVTGKQNISHYLCKFNEKGVLERKIDKNKKMVALTYDDGPSIYTPKLLDTLEKYDAVATFFVVGSRVSQYSGTIKREFNLGCEIGNHTYDHKTITRISSSELKKQISKTNAAVKKVTGGNPVVMRPPGGGINSTSKSNLGMPAIIWSVDTLDWKTRSSSQTTSAVLNHVHDGDIILMHDLHSAACDAAATIVPTLIDRGYQLVTVSELAECRSGMKKNQSYFKFTK